ncbi:MAG: 50S ribosomal protein L23 [Sphingobacteriales bacterium]|jgi:large subunit ribosomal protein L23|nr:50S ribosomal protein L23 [Sphingobacteriales bacterium]
MSKDVLVRPLINEKSEKILSKIRQYSFIVDVKSNKIEIKKAVEEMYGVNVAGVSTLIAPTKKKRRITKRGVLEGRTKKIKKAFVTLREGDEINFYEGI